MTRNKEKGLWLRPMEDAGNTGWIPGTAAAMLTSCAMILSISDLSGFTELYGCAIMLLTGILLCAVHGGLTMMDRRNWFVPFVLMLLLVLVLLGRQYLLEGMRLFWNQLGDAWTAQTGWVLPALEKQLGEERSESCLLLFSVAVGTVISLVCCLLVSRQASVLAAVLPGLLLGAMVWFGKETSLRSLTAILVLAVLLLLYSGWEKKKTAGPALINWALWAVMAFIVVFGANTDPAQSWAADVSQRLHDAIHESRYETSYTTLPEGDLRNGMESSGEAQPGLVVNMQYPEAIYLRGFTGAEFHDDVWSALDTRTLEENEELLYWLNLEAFDPSAQFAAAASLEGFQSNVITIQNLGACSQYLYVPFSLNSGSWLQTGDLNESVDGNGQRMYVYTAVSGGNDEIRDVLDLLQNSDAEEVLNYRKAETAYRKFVSQSYLQIPGEAELLLGELWNAAAARYGDGQSLTREEAQACVLMILSQCFPEEGMQENLELPANAAKGTSYQYATVAVLTLRYFGFPARYAEGYIITDEMAAAAQDGASIPVDSSHAAAWAEVYQEGIGWLPMELMPGFGHSAGSAQQDTDSQDNAEANGTGEDTSSERDAQTVGQPQLELPEQTQTQEPEPQTNNGFALELPRVLVQVLEIALITLLLLLLALVIRRKIFSERRRKKFQGENRNDAAAWIFADTTTLLEQMGLDRGNGSMEELFEPASDRFGQEYAQRLREMTRLNARAMFSSHPMDETQTEALLSFRGETLQRLKTETKWNKRLWMKWILCLY